MGKMKRDGGKGDKPRPIPDRKKFEDNWDAIFKKKKVKVTVYGVEIEKTQEEWDAIFKKKPAEKEKK